MRDFSSRPRRRGPTPFEWGLIAVGGAALLFSAWSAFTARREGARVRARLDQARAEVQAVQARAQGLDERRDSMPLLTTQALLTADAPPARVVSDLAALMPGDVRLESLRLVYGGRVQVEMRVAAREAAGYDLFLERLARSASFTEVLPGDENREGEVRAMVRAVWRGAGA